MKTNLPSIEHFGDCLVTLHNGARGLRGGLRVEIQPLAETGAEPVLEFMTSDETLDRYEEMIMAAGWELDAYRRNPVFQNSHQYGDILFTLGRAEATEIRVRTAGEHLAPQGSPTPRLCLYQRIRFAVEANPLAKIAYDLYRGRFLNAVSVGFVPLEWLEGKAAYPARRKYLRQELLEVSAVSVPANPNALALAVKSGAVAPRALEDLAGLLHRLRPAQADAPSPAPNPSRSPPADPPAHARASGGAVVEAQWLHLGAQLLALRDRFKRK